MKQQGPRRLFISIFFLSVFLFGGIRQAEAWWNNNYSYRNKITITNSTGGTVVADTIVLILNTLKKLII